MTDGLPMLWLGYNPNHQIVQTPDHAVILHEMFRDRRIIPLDGGPHADVRQWNGDIEADGRAIPWSSRRPISSTRQSIDGQTHGGY